MSDPRHFASPLDPDARALIERARDGGGPTSMQKARVHWATKQKLAAGAAGALGLATWSTAAKATLSLASVVVTTSAFVGGIGYLSSERTRLAPSEQAAPPRDSGSVATLTRPTPDTRASTVALSEQKSEPSSPPTNAASNSARRMAPLAAQRAEKAGAQRQPEPSGADLASEVRALAAARRALRDGDAAAARKHLEKYDGAVQGGALKEERAATEVLVLCSQGKVSAARAAVARFHRDHPGSPLATRLDESCVKRAPAP